MARVRVIVLRSRPDAARYLERAGAEVTVVERASRGRPVHTCAASREQHAERARTLSRPTRGLVSLAGMAPDGPHSHRRLGLLWRLSERPRRCATRSTRSSVSRSCSRPRFAPTKPRTRAGTRVSRWLARQSVSDWIERARPGRELAAGLRGLRGFFLADPERLSLLQLVDQFASDDIPGEGSMFRLRDGNDALPSALARGASRPRLPQHGADRDHAPGIETAGQRARPRTAAAHSRLRRRRRCRRRRCAACDSSRRFPRRSGRRSRRCATAAPRACCCSSSRGSGSTSAGR